MLQNEVETEQIAYFLLVIILYLMALIDYYAMSTYLKRVLRSVFQEHRYRKIVIRSLQSAATKLKIAGILVILGCGIPTMLVVVFRFSVAELPMWLFRGMVAIALVLFGAELTEQNHAKRLLEVICEEIETHEKEVEIWGAEERKWLITLSDGGYKGPQIRTWQDETLPKIDRASEIDGRLPRV